MVISVWIRMTSYVFVITSDNDSNNYYRVNVVVLFVKAPVPLSAAGLATDLRRAPTTDHPWFSTTDEFTPVWDTVKYCCRPVQVRNSVVSPWLDRIVPRNRQVLTGNYYVTTADTNGFNTAVRTCWVHHWGQFGRDPWLRDKMMSSSKLGKLVGIHPRRNPSKSACTS